jgi:signal transduction histidine kinase
MEGTTMLTPPTATTLDQWERRGESAIAALPYGMLVVSIILTVLLPPHRNLLLLDLVLAVAAAGWILWMFTLHPAWRTRGPLMTVFFAGLVVLMAALVITDPWFGFFSFTAYFFVYFLSAGLLRVLGVIIVAVITATSQNGGLPKPTAGALTLWGVIVLVNVCVASGITWFGWVSEEQHNRRKQMVTELAETNQKLEATLAENAGLHRQLLTQAREAGIQDERQRLAREIHDTLAQGLTGIITQLEAADQPGAPATDRDRHLSAARRLARDSLREARRSVDALRPEQLERAALPEALGGVTRQWSELTGIRADVTTTGTPRPMHPEAESALLRTAQEALANVARHAAATRVGLTLSYMGDEVALDVRDDGTGFDVTGARPVTATGQPATGQSAVGSGRRAADTNGQAAGTSRDRPPAARSPLLAVQAKPSESATASGPAAAGQAATTDAARAGGGFGLTAMRQRVEGLAGTLEIESEPGAGTAICARIPALPPEGAR